MSRNITIEIDPDDLTELNGRINALEAALLNLLPVNDNMRCFYCDLGNIADDDIHFDNQNLWGGDRECLWHEKYAEAVKVFRLKKYAPTSTNSI